MEINEYQQLAFLTANKNLTLHQYILNAALGLAGESGEVADLVKKWQFQGHDLSNKKVLDEIGDILWYCALMATAMGVELKEVMQRNIDKLKIRFPEGFSSQDSIDRVDYSEKELEPYDPKELLDYDSEANWLRLPDYC